MAFPHARLLEITRLGIVEIDLMQTDHFKLYREFVADPRSFVDAALASEDA
jgi:predicted ATPase